MRIGVVAVVCVSVFLVGCSRSGVSPATTPRTQPIAASEGLRNVVAAARTYRADHGSYRGLGPGALAEIYNGVCYEQRYVQAGSCGDGALIVEVISTPARFGAAAISDGNRCLWITDDAAGVRYGSGFPCTGEAALKANHRDFPTSA